MKKIYLLILLIFIGTVLFAEEYAVNFKNEVKISKLKEKGYEIIIPKNTFKNDEILKVEEKFADIKDLTSLISLDLSVKGKENQFISFQNPFKVKIKLNDTSDFQNLLLAFSDEKNNVSYYIPHYVNFKEKTCLFYINHLGLWSLGKGKGDIVGETWALKWFLLLNGEESIKRKVKEATNDSFEEFLKSLDIVDNDSIDSFQEDFYSVLKCDNALATLNFVSGNNLSKSNEKEINKAVNDTIVWQIYRVLEKNTKIEGVSSVFLGKLNQAADYANSNLKFDSVDKIKSITSNNSQKEAFRDSLRDTVRKELIKGNKVLYSIALEEAFGLYSGKITLKGFENAFHNIDECMKFLNMETEIYGVNLSDYCKVLCIKPEDMTESSKLRLARQFKSELEEYFKDREKSQNIFEENKEVYIGFINQLLKVNLLSTFGNEKCFNDKNEYYFNSRLKKIYNIYALLCLITSNDPFDNIYTKDMVSHILAYVQGCNDENSYGFYNYLIEKKLAQNSRGFKKIETKSDNNYSSSSESTGSVLGDILVSVLTGSKYGTKEKGYYNLVDIKEHRGYRFSGSDGYWTYKDEDFRYHFKVNGMPAKIKPGSSESITLVIEKGKAPLYMDKRMNFEIEVYSNDFSFNRNKLSGSAFSESKDTITMRSQKYSPRSGDRVNVTVTCRADNYEAGATYIYEYL